MSAFLMKATANLHVNNRAQMKTIDQNEWVTDLVKDDYRIAKVLSRHGINYCCGGRHSLKLACEARGLNVESIVAKMDSMRRTICVSPATRFDVWPLDFLIDYIINIHHEFLRMHLEQIGDSLSGFVEGHKNHLGGLVELEDAFKSLNKRLWLHIAHEEEMIFPYIKKLFRAYSNGEPYASMFVRTLRKPIEDVMTENEQIGHDLQRIRELTRDFQLPEKACASHRVALMSLQELDGDLVQHIHLENNILFPGAIAMEHELSQSVDGWVATDTNHPSR